MSRFWLGDLGSPIDIPDEWRVLDVGSGQNPHPRANVLLEKFPDDDAQRSGQSIDTRDPRLVVGDALAMPFDDHEFDFVIASHLAEHIDDPRRLCAELMRVSRRGYVETPGWLWDFAVREPFHIWRVRKTRTGLRFDEVDKPRPLGVVGDLLYGLVYMGSLRPGHWALRTGIGPADAVLRLGQRAFRKIRQRPFIRELVYTAFEFDGPFTVDVRPSGGSTDSGPSA
jgi:SAM-dependent methyltransferase